MSKSKLRGVVGYTCYTRPSLQCTYLSSLKPGKSANDEGSFLPVAYRGRYDRASTAPAGKTRTINQNMSTELGEPSYQNLERPNPNNVDFEKILTQTQDGQEGESQSAHWRSIAAQSFAGDDGPAAEPTSWERDDMPQVTKPAEAEPERDPNVLEMARQHAHKLSNARPGTQKFNSRMRPLTQAASRPESREGQALLRGKHRGGVAGTSQASKQIPGYGGFLPVSEVNDHALMHGFGNDSRASLKETLFDSYRKVLPGYTGFQPASVHNVRTFDVPLVTTHGATNHSMLELGSKLKRPEAGGESLILKEMFQAPLEGRPSDNGVANAQLYYCQVRPYEGLPRIHYPSKTHMVGCKFASTSVTSLGESGVNTPLRFDRRAASGTAA